VVGASVSNHSHSVPSDHPTLEAAHSVKCELAEKILRSFGSLRLQVRGFSMLPSVWPGDLLLIRRQEVGEIFPGDIVLFARDGRLIAHRVVLRTGGHETMRLITRGDGLPAQDHAITSAELLGKVSFIRRAGKWIEPSARLGFGVRVMAALVSRSGRVATILVRFHAMRHYSGRKQEVPCER
jgi:signal peptidase I